ncbi:MAG: Asp-tRNA(Asn)/Glu-tRNA(Gln) amidotransferase subunit GatC [Candidatus Paceibacterota bacterium]
MIEKDQVKHIAKLARLELSEDELEEFQEELSDILDYVDQLKELDVSDVEPTSHSVDIKNVMRDDEAKDTDPERVKKLRKAFPDEEDGYDKVKSILE